jgi:hypothetical protein
MTGDQTMDATPESAGPERAVDAALDAAGLEPAPFEREALVAMWEPLKRGVELLYAVDDARYETPAVVFGAAPNLARWGT